MAATMLGNVVHPSHQVGTARRSCTTPVAFAKKSIVSLPTAKNVMNLIKQRGMDVSVRAVAPTETSGLSKPISPYTGEPEWYALVARAEFFFNDVQNEALAEQLRELKRYYEEIDRELDFFFVSEPAWLEKFPESKAVKRPSVALISTDKQWITFMKLRLDRVLKLDLGKMNIDDATKSTAPLPKFNPPEKWTAPYSAYASGWWEVFMRK